MKILLQVKIGEDGSYLWTKQLEHCVCVFFFFHFPWFFKGGSGSKKFDFVSGHLQGAEEDGGLMAGEAHMQDGPFSADRYIGK